MASYVAAYRIGVLVSTAGALFIVSGFRELQFGLGAAWTLGYLAMAAVAVIGVATALFASEPEKSAAAQAEHAGALAEKIRFSACSRPPSARSAIFSRATWRS